MQKKEEEEEEEKGRHQPWKLLLSQDAWQIA